ncbi:hypothetical protein ATZ36_17630 [Candidatus Endomicrobiellum trichonymphae]|uniref:Uncharacterized protein n=1 Tax=Endomicrobium trichonymphae TaxID=1408204 RepID=A0A1E5IKY5_ENDTX|nr:hypothetical protein ATZ36_17630 [Candidatus Endomicrobium trichonymphae]
MGKMIKSLLKYLSGKSRAVNLMMNFINFGNTAKKILIGWSERFMNGEKDMMTKKNFISFSTVTSAILPIWRKPLLFLFTVLLRSQTQV